MVNPPPPDHRTVFASRVFVAARGQGQDLRRHVDARRGGLGELRGEVGEGREFVVGEIGLAILLRRAGEARGLGGHIDR